MNEEHDDKVVITKDDIKNITDFFTHFQIDIPDRLQGNLENYNQDKFTLDEQEKLKIALCEAITHSQHELFKDELFKSVVEKTKKIAYDAEFERQVEDALTEDQESD